MMDVAPGIGKLHTPSPFPTTNSGLIGPDSKERKRGKRKVLTHHGAKKES